MGEVQRDTPENVRSSVAGLRADGWRVFVLPDGVDTAARFVDAVVSTFPLDPPLTPTTDSWNALDDSLGNGLLDIPERRIAILWPDSFRLAHADPESHAIALSILGDLPEVLRCGDWTNDGKPKETAIFLGVAEDDDGLT
jgi:hypothetical protein